MKMGDIIILVLVMTAMIMIIVRAVRQRKKGKYICCGNCSGCSSGCSHKRSGQYEEEREKSCVSGRQNF